MVHTRTILSACAALLVSASGAAGQAWDTPSFFAPRPGEDIGAYVVMPDADGADAGFHAIWRQAGNLSLGVRGGFVSDAIHLGAEFYGGLPIAAFPLDMSWIVGAGGSFDDDVTWVRIPVGVSIGKTLGTAGGFTVQPYVHPRVSLDIIAVGEGDNEATETDANFTIDLGADFAITPQFAVKIGGSFGDVDAWGAGIAWRMPRRVRGN